MTDQTEGNPLGQELKTRVNLDLENPDAPDRACAYGPNGLKKPSQPISTDPACLVLRTDSQISSFICDPDAPPPISLGRKTVTALRHQLSSTSAQAKGASICRTLKRIRTSHVISGQDYSVLSVLCFLLTVSSNLLVFGVLYAIAVSYTSITTHTHQKVVGLICVGIGLCVVYADYTLTLGYCMWYHKSVLIRTRGLRFMSIILAAVGWVVLAETAVCLIDLEVMRVPGWLYTFLQGIKQVAWLIYLGAQVSRQRLLYIIFIKSAYKVQSVDSDLFSQSMAIAVLWAFLGAGTSAVIIWFRPTELWQLILLSSIIFYSNSVLVMLYYYSWKAKKISKSFNDWRDNLLSSTGNVLAPTTLLLIRAFTEIPSIEIIFLQTFLVFGAMSSSVVQLFGQLALIQYSNWTVARDLDPKQLFATQCEKRDIKVGSSCHSQTSPGITTTGSCGVLPGSDRRVYGPQAVSRNGTLIVATQAGEQSSSALSTVSNIAPATQLKRCPNRIYC